MGGFVLAVLLLTWALKKAVGDSIVDNNLAKQGIVPPRAVGRYGSAAAAKVADYGFTGFLRDNWRDYWSRRTDAVIAARDLKAANPGERVRFRDRLAAGVAVLSAAGVKAKSAARKLVEPAWQDRPPTGPQPAAPVLAEPELGTVRFTDHGRERWTGTAWEPAPEPPAPAAAVPAPASTSTPTVRPSTGGTMTAPTGEAVNYETTVAELDKLIGEQQKHLDACTAAQAALAAAKGHIGDMQESYRASSAAATSTHEHLDALHLDSSTLASTGATADAMPAGAVDTYFDQLEQMEEMARVRREAAEVALHSTEAARSNVVEKYGDAHTTVAGELSGDARFLDTGAGTVGAAA